MNFKEIESTKEFWSIWHRFAQKEGHFLEFREISRIWNVQDLEFHRRYPMRLVVLVSQGATDLLRTCMSTSDTQQHVDTQWYTYWLASMGTPSRFAPCHAARHFIVISEGSCSLMDCLQKFAGVEARWSSDGPIRRAAWEDGKSSSPPWFWTISFCTTLQFIK